MRCYHCSTDIRPDTIICPVCNRIQNQNILERAIDRFRETIQDRLQRKKTTLLNTRL